MKIGFFDQTWVQKQRKQFGNNEKFSAALGDLLSAANPYGTTGDKASTTSPIECCICIGNMSTFQALFISPCSHCYHFKCVASMINQSAMFQCPLCRQVANLTASVSSDSLHLAGNEDVGELYVEQPIVGNNQFTQKKEIQ